MGISPDAEPTPADLKNLISTIKDNQVKYVSLKLLSVPESLKLSRKPPELKRWCLIRWKV